MNKGQVVFGCVVLRSHNMDDVRHTETKKLYVGGVLLGTVKSEGGKWTIVEEA